MNFKQFNKLLIAIVIIFSPPILYICLTTFLVACLLHVHPVLGVISLLGGIYGLLCLVWFMIKNDRWASLVDRLDDWVGPF